MRDHVLLPYAASIADADARLAPKITPALLGEIAAAVPEGWLDGGDASVYADYLSSRLEEPRGFVEEAENARGR